MNIYEYYNESLSEDELSKILSLEPHLIRYVDNKTEKLCLIAIGRDPDCIRFLNEKEQTKEICLASLTTTDFIEDFDCSPYQDGSSLRYIKKQTMEYCLLALEKSPFNLFYIRGEVRESEEFKIWVKESGFKRMLVDEGLFILLDELQ